ncbi:MAG: tRNA uridine-5-carboxymethylaminomethyl(34) synthesis GTPase MnmE [Treponemataceae bacterium]|nr:tRNA uridine-5-carboxymethylaminomethyl(34) synthesis GTPase MnmE [Treponemataceae bacterium]
MINEQYTPEEPIVAIATALVPSALGIVRSSGKNVIELVSKCFSRPKALISAQANTLVYGWIINPKNGSKIDEVMLAVYKAPKSFTGEDMVEVFCHGGTSTVLGVYQALLSVGFRAAQKGEYTFRAFINGKADLTKAEAVREIIGAKTDESRSRAANRLQGALYSEIQSVKEDLLKVLASIEVGIEYPEDEENIAETFDDSELKKIIAKLETLSSSWQAEKLYQEGAEIVLCGKTNAGKSSLFNLLLKEDRAIVSDIHGTTRDFIESYASFDGIPVRLFDTAGLRETEDEIEKVGVERTRELITHSDAVLYVIDASVGFTDDDEEFLKTFTDKNASTSDVPLILLMNKVDKADLNDGNSLKKALPPQWADLMCYGVSAKTGRGLLELTKAVATVLQKSCTEKKESAGLGSERQKEVVEEALKSCRHALLCTKEGFTLDAAVQDIEDAAASLGELTGEITSADILETVFSQFCVGK